MRFRLSPLLAVALLAIAAPVVAAEKGVVIRPGDLLAQPFIDAAKSGPLAANQPVTILLRKGAWVQVEAGGRTGWVRTLNVRMEAPPSQPQPAAGKSAASRPSINSLRSPSAMLRTGSSGRTVTTGVKGLDEEDIRQASINYQQLDQLAALGVPADEAKASAAQSKLAEVDMDYLKKGRGK